MGSTMVLPLEKMYALWFILTSVEGEYQKTSLGKPALQVMSSIQTLILHLGQGLIAPCILWISSQPATSNQVQLTLHLCMMAILASYLMEPG